MTQFEVGTTYYTRSIGDHNCIIALTVTARTARTVTTRDAHGKVQTFRPAICGNAESVKPWGNYSMSPIVEATDTKVLRADWERAS